MEKKGFMQFVIYSRKSKFTGKGDSIGNQIELCREYIATHYSKEEAEAARVYEDEGFSGGTLERPQFQQMMKDSRDIQFSAIVVYRLDRISRNIGDFAKLIEDLGNRNIDFISIREQFEPHKPLTDPRSLQDCHHSVQSTLHDNYRSDSPLWAIKEGDYTHGQLYSQHYRNGHTLDTHVDPSTS